MKKIVYIVALLAIISSCSTPQQTPITRMSQYPGMYEEKPRSLLVMPPINNTENVEAKELLYTTVNMPLINSGYYVFSPLLAMEVFKTESAYDAELFINGSLEQFGNVFGADAVVFSKIERWEKSGGGIATNIRYIVKSTKTNNVLFERYCELFLDLKGNYNSGNFLTNLIVNFAVGVVSSALTEHVKAARMANNYIFNDLPAGCYATIYGQDGEMIASNKDVQITLNGSYL